jgi:hypothetical protein
MTEPTSPLQLPGRRRCAGGPNGAACRAAPLHGSDRCPMHDLDPVRAAQVAKARVEGGRRRHKETVVGIVYDFHGLDTVTGIGHLLDSIVTEALSLPPGVPRLRVLLAALGQAIKLHEVGALTTDVAALKAVFGVAAAGTGPGGHPASRAIYDPDSAKSLLEDT